MSRHRAEVARGGRLLCGGWVAAALLLSPAAALAGSFVRQPYPQDVGSRQAALSFELDAPRNAKLSIWQEGADAGAPVEVTSAARESSQELVATGLSPATRYRWKVVVEDGTSEEGTLRTAPEDDRPISFVVYGDNRTDRVTHDAIVRQLTATSSDLLIHTGDMVQDGSRWGEWLEWLAIERPLIRDRPLFPAIGNHEIGLPGGDGPTLYARVFRVPSAPGANERFYTFRWGMARFFMLDAQEDFDAAEREWLDRALGAADAEQGVRFRFAVMHHGPYSAGLHGGNEAARIAKIPELLIRHKIDVLFAGHDHNYERGDASGLRYVVSGGGGAPLYRERRESATTQRFEAVHHFVRVDLAGNTGTIRVQRVDGSLLETCNFAAGGAGGWSCDVAPPNNQPPRASTGSAATQPPPAAATPNGGPSPSRACGCGWSSARAEWLALAAAALLVGAAALRRDGRSS